MIFDEIYWVLRDLMGDLLGFDGEFLRDLLESMGVNGDFNGVD